MDIEQLRRAIDEQAAGWEPRETPIVELVAAEDTNLFGLALSEPDREDLLARAAAMESEGGLLASLQPPPPSADWRVGGHCTAVGHQQTCGACVAFATCAALEARARITADDPGLLIDLSEAHLFHCGNPGGCDGGWEPEGALQRAMKVGVGREEDLPYQGAGQQCVEIDPVLRVTNWTAETTIDGRKRAVAFGGPVIAGMRVFEDLPYYSSGVYQRVSDECAGLHAVCVVGYSDEESCWIVKNSWGTAWGESGYVRIAYGQCGLDSEFPFFDPEVELIGGS